MSKLEVDTIAPQSGTTITVGESGDTVTIPTGVTLDASNATTTLPATVVTTDGTQTLTNKSIAATQLTGTITPSDGTVTNAKIVDSTIELAKLSATGTKDATTFLRGDNTFAEAGGGVNTPYFYAFKSSNQTGLTNDVDTKYQADTEDFDSDGCYNNTGSTVTLNGISTPSYSFAPNVAGKYILFGSLLLSGNAQNDAREGAIRFFKNGSALNFIESTNNYTSYSLKKFRITSEMIVDANGTSDYFHITGRIVFSTSGQIQSGDEQSYFGAYKIIE